MGNNILNTVTVSRDNAKPYDAFEHLCGDVFPDKKGGVLAYITVYADASYNHPSPSRPNPPLLHTIGAYVATQPNWRRFRKEWQGELDKKRLDLVHMTDFEHALNAVKSGRPLKDANPYKDWPLTDFIPFLKRLHKIIKRKSNGECRINGFVSSVIKTDFHETLPEELKDEPGCRSPYVFNVASLMHQIANWANRVGYYDPIRYVFEDGDDEAGNLQNWFRYCGNSKTAVREFRLGAGYSLIPKKGDIALQVADIGAYEFNKFFIKITEKGSYDVDMSDHRKSLVGLIPALERCELHSKSEMLKSYPKLIQFVADHGSRFMD